MQKFMGKSFLSHRTKSSQVFWRSDLDALNLSVEYWFVFTLNFVFKGLLLEFPILLHNQRAVLLWTLVPAERDAFLANEATKRFTSSNKLLLEIATSRSSHDLLLVKQAYHVHYKKSPEEDVAYHTSGDLLKEVPAEPDAFLANEATKRFTSSNKLLLEIATSRSSHDLLLVKQAYHVRYKKSLEEDVAYHTSGDLLKRYEGDEISMPLAKKEAKILNEKISDKAYDDVELIRILSTRITEANNYKLDLHSIKQEYHRRISVPLDQEIVKDTSGDYEKFLVELVGHGDA
ncbi:hypothetical protein PRUPE_6G186400 [Prunus persica]|uniref:Annexin n=1 Tax=Prunus persica TaxID=3760 RepID=M5WFP9_PRUPE|nr:annexin D2 [Prunus persica]ONI02239.1 hypothetical protein PRUPE_6G186400 [Prunus persica]